MRRFTSLHPEEARAVPTQDETLVTRDGPVVTLTFNRPEARNAMTWGMYDRLYEVCEEVDADDSVRVLVLRGAGGKAFVAGTDISQFKVFERAEDGIAYERDGDRRIARLEAVRKPVVAQVEGFAVGGGFRIATACDLRIATPDARFGAPIARTLGNCLSMAAYASFVDVFGPSRLKELIFTARLLTAEEAHAAGYVHEIVAAGPDRGAGDRARPAARRARADHALGDQGVDPPPRGEPGPAGRRGPDRHHLHERRLPRGGARVPREAQGAVDRPMIRSVPGRTPRVHPEAYVDPAAQVIGDVTIEAGASVWPFTVLRGDQDNYVTLGRNSNVQDNSVLHVTPEFPCIVGANVTIGHRAVVHACTVMDNVRIGIGAVVLTGAVVEEGAQVGAGALVPPGKVVPAGWLVMGVPAKPVRKMSQDELDDILRNATEYLDLWHRDYR